MKIDLKQETERMLTESGKQIAQFIASAAFKIFEDKTFREMVDFDEIAQLERDRMFNELELSLIGLITLRLDHLISHTVATEEEFVLSKLRSNVKSGFVEIIKSLGIEEEYQKQWDILIDMRLKEYRKDYKVADKESEKLKLERGEQEFKITWARLETITIDCLTHIRRGDVKEGDLLWKFLRRSFVEIDVMFQKLADLVSKRPLAQT